MALVQTNLGNAGRPRGAHLVWNAADGIEAAPTLVTQGFMLDSEFIKIHVHADVAMNAAGFLKAYLWNPFTEAWDPVGDPTTGDGPLDVALEPVTAFAHPGFSVIPGQRMCFVPSGNGAPLDIYVYW